MKKNIFLLRMLVTAGLVVAAGSGCAKPAAFAEKTIISDPRVAALDAQHNIAYKKALRNAPAANSLRTQQRKWLAEVRDRCRDAECLITQYTVRNAQLASPAASDASCPVKEDDLLSHWQRVKGGDFEEFALTRQANTRSFASWLNHRPEMMGTWYLDKCILNIENPDDPKLSFAYKITSFTSKVLQLQDADGGPTMSYKKSAAR